MNDGQRLGFSAALEQTATDSMLDQTRRSELGSFRYWAFISYSHSDKSWGEWLHKSLEAFKVPRGLSAADGRSMPTRIFPVFRDKDELPASSDLGKALAEALDQSRVLVVICSRAAAKSLWVDQEVSTFQSSGKGERILCLIVDGEPNASAATGATSTGLECFPVSLRNRGSDDTKSWTEPLAVDARTAGDNRRQALLRIAAGILGVGFDALARRDERRRARRNLLLVSAVLTVVSLAVLQQYLHGQRLTVERNQAQLRTADSQVARAGMLVGRGSFAEAKQLFRQAGVAYLAHDRSAMAADLGVALTLEKSPDPDYSVQLHKDAVTMLVASPAGDVVASGDAAGHIHLWNATTGRLLRSLTDHRSQVILGRFSGDGKQLVTLGKDRRILVSNVQDGKLVTTLPLPDKAEWGEVIGASFIATGPSVGLLLSETAAPNIVDGKPVKMVNLVLHVVDYERGKETAAAALGTLEERRQPTSFEVAPDGDTALLGMVDGAIVMSIKDDGAPNKLVNIEGHVLLDWYTVNQITITPDGRHVALGYSDDVIELWDLRTRKMLQTKRTFTKRLRSLDLAHGSDVGARPQLVLGGGDGSITAGSDGPYGTARVLTIGGASISKLLVLPASGIVLAGRDNGGIEAWPLNWKFESRANLDGLGMLPHFSSSPDGSRILVTSMLEKALTVLSGEQMAKESSIEFPEEVFGAAMTSDASYVWVAFESGRIVRWDLAAKRQDRQLADAGPLEEVAASPGNDQFFALGKDGVIRAFDSAGNEVASSRVDAAKCDCKLAVGQGGMLAIADREHTVAYRIRNRALEKVWSIANERADPVLQMAASRDGRWLALTNGDSIAVREMSSGNAVSRMPGHAGATLGLAFSWNPGVLVSGGRDGSIKLWQVETGAELLGLEGFAPVFGLSVLPNERIVASVMGDRKIYGEVDAYYWRLGKPR